MIEEPGNWAGIIVGVLVIALILFGRSGWGDKKPSSFGRDMEALEKAVKAVRRWINGDS